MCCWPPSPREPPGRGPAHSVIAAGLLAAQRSLLQLRSGLARRAMSRDAAIVLAGSNPACAGGSARTLRAMPALPPATPAAAETAETAETADAISGWLGQLPGLQAGITRLFDDTGHTAGVPVPVP